VGARSAAAEPATSRRAISGATREACLRHQQPDYFANFQDFLADCPKDEPFCFWYGGHEPHRLYEYGSGVAKAITSWRMRTRFRRIGPTPNLSATICSITRSRSALRRQLGRMIDLLAEKGLLDNTLIVATSDNGRHSAHERSSLRGQLPLPLAMMWPKGIASPAQEEALVSFVDFAPTFLAWRSGRREGRHAVHHGKQPDRPFRQPEAGPRALDAFAGPRAQRRSHPAGLGVRLGYPVRACARDFLFLHNFDPSRWPCGNPNWVWRTPMRPTKTAVEAKGEGSQYWQLCFGKRPRRTLQPQDRWIASRILRLTRRISTAEPCARDCSPVSPAGDPRMEGKGDVFDNYQPQSKPEGGQLATP